MATYLDFEEPIKALEDQIQQTKEIGVTTDVDMSDKIAELEEKLKEKTKEVFSKLTGLESISILLLLVVHLTPSI